MTMPEPTKLLIAGDWHGNTGWARSVIQYAAHRGCDTIVQCGDFGFWCDTPETTRFLSSLQADLDEYEMRLYWVDGNHEDHDRIARGWRGAPPTVPALTAGYDRIWYLPRGYRWQWFGKTWMAVGGAVSVDRLDRTEGKSWWPAETLTDEQIAHCCRPGQVDVIVAHDCPLGIDIPGVGADFDPECDPTRGWRVSALIEANHHRAKLRRIWDATGATYLYHGHYHVGYERHGHRLWRATGTGGQTVQAVPTRVVGLDCDGSRARDHLRIVTEKDFT